MLEKCDYDLVALVKRARVDPANRHDALHPMDVIDLGIMLCSALAAAHRGARSLHLDVKPGNVLFKKVSDGTETAPTAGTSIQPDNPPPLIALLSDFGLSKLVPPCVYTRLESANTRFTRTMAQGVGAGTIGFAPPEQVKGHGRRRSDVYGLGATLVFALTGQNPFPNMRESAIMARLFEGMKHCLHLPSCLPRTRGINTKIDHEHMLERSCTCIFHNEGYYQSLDMDVDVAVGCGGVHVCTPCVHIAPQGCPSDGCR